MIKQPMRYMLAVCAIAGGFGFTGAQAFVGAPIPTGEIGLTATPVAMCGYTCRNGGRYIPGPPRVCAERGLEYCGSSRDAEPQRGPSIQLDFGRSRDRDEDRRRGGDRGSRRSSDDRGRGGSRESSRPSGQSDSPCRQRLTNNKGEGYWGPGRNCDQERR